MMAVHPDPSASAPLFADMPLSAEIPENPPIEAPVLRDWAEQERSYQKRLPSSIQELAESDKPRPMAAKELIKDLQKAKIGKLAKIEFVNEWVNRSIGYEKRKVTRMTEEGIPDVNWHQTPGETLERGTGACSDIARLKQYMLTEIGIDPKDTWLVGGSVNEKELVAGKPRAFLGYHEQLVVAADGQKYVLNDNRNMGDKRSGGIEPLQKQFSGETPNAWGAFEAYTVSQNGQVQYLDANQSWLTTHDPARIEKPHAPNRHALSVAAAGATFDVPADQKKEIAHLSDKHLKNALQFNPFATTGGEQPGERDHQSTSPQEIKEKSSTQTATETFHAAIQEDAKATAQKALSTLHLTPMTP